jgi:hypothetical protein
LCLHLEKNRNNIITNWRREEWRREQRREEEKREGRVEKRGVERSEGESRRE